MPVRFEDELGAVGFVGDTTVNQRASPRGISVFFWNPRTSV
jgi:hypothetical protein